MSQENVEIVRRWWASLEAGELPFDLTDENVRIDNIDQPVVKGAFHGHDGLRRWWQDFTESLADIHHEVLDSTALDARRVLTEIRSQGHFRETWESAWLEPHEFIEAGDLVVVPGTQHVKGRGGIEVVARGAFVWTIRNGAIERMVMYQEKEDALEAVGLSEQDAHADS